MPVDPTTVSVRALSRELGISRHAAAKLRAKAEAVAVVADSSTSNVPKILVVGDAHFAHGQDLRRASALGRFIRQRLGPKDHVVIIGDWFSLDSLCSYSKVKELEGARLAKDLDAGNQAIRLVEAELDPATRPTFHVTLGNHEARIERLAADHPMFEGLIGANLFEFEAHGWTTYELCEPLRLEGWRFQHYYQNAMGRAISSEKYGAQRVMEALGYSESAVFGHTHKLNIAHHATSMGGKRWVLNVGWFAEHYEEYAGTDQNARWWSGLVLLNDVADGDASVELVRMASVLAG